jgi:hypothetical protein
MVLSVMWLVPAGAMHRFHSRSPPAAITSFFKEMGTDMCGQENRTELPLASSAWGCNADDDAAVRKAVAFAGYTLISH